MIEESRPAVALCLRCDWLFVSKDKMRLRICPDCRACSDDYVPRTASARAADGSDSGDHQ